MPPHTFTPVIRMRFLYPPAARPISTTPHLYGGGPPPKKPRVLASDGTENRPKKDLLLSTTSFPSHMPRHEARRPPKPRPGPAVMGKIIPTGPSRDRIHYIPPSNPLRSKLGPGMYYNARDIMHRRSSTPLDKDVETEYLYTLMLRKVFSTPTMPAKVVALKYAMKRCMEATGSHKKASGIRLRKGFLGEAIGTTMTKKKTWVCDYGRAGLFDWDLHENMRFIHGPLFTGREVDYYTPEGQVLGAQRLEKPDPEQEPRNRFHEAMEILQRDNAATATTATTSKIAGIAVASDCDSDSDGKVRDDWVLEASGSDTDTEALMTGGARREISTGVGWVEPSLDSDGELRDGSDTDFDALMTAGDEEWEDDESQDEDEDKIGGGRGGGRGRGRGGRASR